MKGLSIDLRRKLLLSVGTHRAKRPLSPVEVGQAVQASLDAGSSLGEIAESLHLEDTSVLTKFVRLLRLTPEIRHVVDWGRSASTIGFTAASEIAKLSDPTEQAQLCEAALVNQMGSGEVKQVVQLHNRSKRPIKTCVEEILRLRPHVQRFHVLLGAIRSPEVRARLSELEQTERDRTLRSIVETAYPGLEFNCRLGTDGFTLTGGEEVARALSQGGKEDFETLINDGPCETVSP
jgi:hypothetical protein